AYDVEATDPDGDTVTFSLTTSPQSASIDPTTGLISFGPTTPGIFPFTVQADDGHGGIASQSFQVIVNDGLPNQLPVIVSGPVTTALIGQPYAYTVVASDPDGDALHFFLTQEPAGMVIDRDTGVISWTPTAVQLGPNDVTVRVLDSHGGAATQSFQVLGIRHPVQGAPRIISPAPASAQGA